MTEAIAGHECFIGLDIGTTSIKAVAFDAVNTELTASSVPTPTHRLSGGGAEYDAEELWSSACAVLRDVTSALDAAGHRAVSVAAASIGEAGVLIDEAARPLAPVVSWFDPRTTPQAEWWVDQVGVARTKRITGLTPKPVFGALKMMWTQQHLSAQWAAGHRWLNMADWAAFRLGGAMATDYSLASRTMLLDLSERRWSDEVLNASGLDGSKLAPVVPSGTPLGLVTAEAAARTGLPSDVVVGAGGHDHVCAALGLGITEPGMLLDSIGTAEAFFLVTDGVDVSGRVAAAGINQGLHVEHGRTYAMTGLDRGGGRIDARRQALNLEWEEFLRTPEAESAIDDLAREGQAKVDLMLDSTDITDVRHIVTGGGSRNEKLIERKRTLGDRPIEVAEQTEAAALGAALLGRRAKQAWS